MLPDQVSNPGPLTYESGALPNKSAGVSQNGSGQIGASACISPFFLKFRTTFYANNFREFPFASLTK